LLAIPAKCAAGPAACPLPIPGAVTSTLRAFFEPRTVAVIGASRQADTVGGAIFRNLAFGGFHGQVVPVHPSAATIEGITAYSRIDEVPFDVDLAVVVVPADAVERVVDDCIAKQVPAIVVISAGFGEMGAEGHAREIALRDRVRAAGLRMIGPNCMGVLNTDAAVHLNASFSPVFPPAGGIAFSSQSGALGLAILEYARTLNLGMSTFVSVGNKADVSSNDLLEYWEHDPHTQVILLYLESFGNPRRFSTIARRVARRTPIVAVKSGRSVSGARAATSHTGALASPDTMVDALFRDAGVIRTDTLEELFDVAALLAHQPLPTGRGVAILTNAGGPGILAADACAARGLTIPTLGDETVRGLRAFLPAAASVGNPVDMLATAPADHYRQAIPLLLDDPAVDAVLTIFIPPLVTDSGDAARAIADATHQAVKPVLATFFGAAGVPELLTPIPCYVFPESAARALAHATRYAEWRNRPAGTPVTFDAATRARLAQRLAEAVSHDSGWLTPVSVRALLGEAGIPTVGFRIVRSEAEAVSIAGAIGFPVVLKGSGRMVVHKTEANAVRTNLLNDEAVASAYRELASRSDLEDVVLEPMVIGGVEMMVGGVLDASFGPVVVCGSGGTLVELMRDAVLRLAPLSDWTASEMLDEVRGSARLRGFRGSPRLDEMALRAIVLRVGALLDACPAIAELDLNPVMVRRNGAIAVDARVRVTVSDPAPAFA
jgi:acetyl coenzyme A synthetase (ADP forming)-like protein